MMSPLSEDPAPRQQTDSAATARFAELSSPAADLSSSPTQSFYNITRASDPRLLNQLALKLLTQLCIKRNSAALLIHEAITAREAGAHDPNFASLRVPLNLPAEQIFQIGRDCYGEKDLYALLMRWVENHRANGLLAKLSDPHASILEIKEAVGAWEEHGHPEPSPAYAEEARAALITRIMGANGHFQDAATDVFELRQLTNIASNILGLERSHGTYGGKSAGLDLAIAILERADIEIPPFGRVRKPRTVYISSDCSLEYIRHNQLEEFVAQKYKTQEEVEQEYDLIVRLFKGGRFPTPLVTALSAALDTFGDVPLIVRSSSLLEDRFGHPFAGKYKSLFLANSGEKGPRLELLLDAIAEVYASVLNPDAIQYRRERGLLKVSEGMSINVQEVIGTSVGPYHFPVFAGVAFSNNEFRWSPRIKRNDGFMRLVPGLGSMAVDRTQGDYPIMACPGQPGLRLNVTAEEHMLYSPRRMTVIDREAGSLLTVDSAQFLAQHHEHIPFLDGIISRVADGYIKPISRYDSVINAREISVTFNGLLEQHGFLPGVSAMLKVLAEAMKSPVDIEFACDGRHFYLLQNRPQAALSKEDEPAEIPKNPPADDIIFATAKHVPNGTVKASYIVYVDNQAYSGLSGEQIDRVASAVTQLNKILPEKEFVLIGPGRWGSQGDKKLGVPVGYNGISHSAMLIEVERGKGGAELSFGTHFFQDLVENHIKYLPILRWHASTSFNLDFLLGAPSQLESLLPQYSDIAHALRVIHIPAVTDGKVLIVYMNADSNRSLALLCKEQG